VDHACIFDFLFNNFVDWVRCKIEWLDRIKSNNQVVHSLMAQEWRTVNCAADIAAKAEFLVSQTDSSSTVLFTRQSAG
jgi:hypothetical protein